MTDLRRSRPLAWRPAPVRRQRLVVWAMGAFVVMLTVIVGGGVLIAIGIMALFGSARAAERDTARPHEIVLLLPPDPDRRSIITISAAFPDRPACEQAKRRLVVMAKGGRVVCYPAERMQ